MCACVCVCVIIIDRKEKIRETSFKDVRFIFSTCTVPVLMLNCL